MIIKLRLHHSSHFTENAEQKKINRQIITNRDGARKSIWQQEIKRFPTSPSPDSLVDVVIVAGQEAVRSVADLVKEHGIDCDFQRTDAELFALDEKQKKSWQNWFLVGKKSDIR